MTDYVLAIDAELARLQLQARTWEPEAEVLFDRIGIQPGWSCLDLGCGAMGLLGPLARRAGPNGQIVGVDQDVSLLAAARAYVRQEGLDTIELITGDVCSTQLPRSSFDLVHVRFVFPHVASPADLLREMMVLAKPGGILAVQEPDHSSWNFYPPCTQWPRLLRLIEDTFALRGDINIGRRMFSLLREAGLRDVQVRAAVLALQDCHPYMHMPLIGARAMKARMIAAGLTTEAEFDGLVQAVEQCANDPERMQITFTITQVWGRKPF